MLIVSALMAPSYVVGLPSGSQAPDKQLLTRSVVRPGAVLNAMIADYGLTAAEKVMENGTLVGSLYIIDPELFHSVSEKLSKSTNLTTSLTGQPNSLLKREERKFYVECAGSGSRMTPAMLLAPVATACDYMMTRDAQYRSLSYRVENLWTTDGKPGYADFFYETPYDYNTDKSVIACVAALRQVTEYCPVSTKNNQRDGENTHADAFTRLGPKAPLSVALEGYT